MLLVETVSGSSVGDDEESRKDLIENLRPYVEKVNKRCHESVRISLQTLDLYEDEIAALYH